MKLMSKTLWAMASGMCASLISLSAISQDSFIVHDGPPEEGWGLEKYTYISMDGKVTIDPLGQYLDQTTASPEDAVGMPDTSVTTMSLRFDYDAPSGDSSLFELVLPVDSPATHREDIPKGYYRNMRMSFFWDESIAPPNNTVWYSSAKLIVPNVHKIPVYMHADLLNEPFYAGSETYRFFDFIRLRNLFRNDLELEVGRIATNANREFENNYGCSGWYQFRFFGYIDPAFDGANITENGQLNQLPPGITIVDRITQCGSKVDEIDGFPGCATENGTRIALEARVFNDGNFPQDVITLHEIGHTKGLDHEQMEEDNIMHESAQDDNVEIRKDQCPNFSVGKEYVSPELWQE